MTTTEIAVRQNGHVTERDVVDGWIGVAKDVSNLSDYIAETDFVPKALRNKPAAIAACILTGRELGIGPMASLKSIHMVQGVPSLSAEYKRARALAAGHQIVIDDSTSTRCVVRGRRAGADSWVTIAWTLDMAKRAKLSGKDVWQQYPQRMLQARATSELCDLLFPDASLGLETTEVLEDGGALAAAIAGDVAEETPPPAPAQRTARRGRAPQNVPPADAAAPPQHAGPATPPQAGTAGGAPLPPLPGEEDPTDAPGATGSAATTGPAPGAATAANQAQTDGSHPGTSGDGGGEPDDTDYDTPGTATRGKGGQLTAIWTILKKEFEFTEDEKEQARAVCEHILSSPDAPCDLGGTTGNMSRNQAGTVLDTLANWLQLAKADDVPPRQVLVALMAAGTTDA